MAEQVSSRALVGLFVLVTLGILAWGTLQLGGYGFRRAEGYPLVVVFDSAYGVEPQTPVLIAGIKVGEVTHVELYQKQARITLKVLKGVQVHDDAQAVIKTAGIIGEKYIEIEPGSEAAPLLLPGETIAYAASPPDFERLAEKLSGIAEDIKEITESLRYALGTQESRESLRETVLGLERVVRQVEGMLVENRRDVNEIVGSVRRLAALLEEQGPALIDDYSQVALDVRGFVQNVSESVDGYKPRLDQSFDRVDQLVANLNDAASDLRDITERVNRGEGTVGKLLNDPETADRLNTALGGVNELLRQVDDLKTIVSYRGEFRFNELNENRLMPQPNDRRGGLKSYIGLTIQPKDDKYYFFEVISDPAGRVTRKKTIIRDAQGNIVNEYISSKVEDRIKFTVEMAKRIYGVTLRGGMIENSGGVGLDYAIVDPDLKVSLHAFDFSKETNPNLKAELDYYFLRHFFVTAGAEDIINRETAPLFFGGTGVRFDDDDLKLLLTTLPVP